jgi:hypothetical protein
MLSAFRQPHDVIDLLDGARQERPDGVKRLVVDIDPAAQAALELVGRLAVRHDDPETIEPGAELAQLLAGEPDLPRHSKSRATARTRGAKGSKPSWLMKIDPLFQNVKEPSNSPA